jgi:hypothetical protein
MTHVDIVRNELAAGYQEVVARLWVEDDEIKMDAVAGQEDWMERLLKGYAGVLDMSDAHAFLAHLHERLHGDYVFASPPHDEANCPPLGQRVAMQIQPVVPQAEHALRI